MVILMNKKLIKLGFLFFPFILSFLVNYLYQLIPFPIFTIYSPINESIFEHTKLVFTPLILTYLIFYFLFKNKINLKTYLSSLIISIAIGIISMLAIYYFFTLFFYEVPALINILLLLISLVFSQYIASYTYKRGISWSIEISIYSLITMTVLLILLTINPPYLEFFIDNSK